MLAELIEPILRSLVDDPDSLEVHDQVIVPGKKVTLVVLAPKSDLGKLLGRNGANARAIRALLTSLSGRHRCTYSLVVDELEGDS